jgi:hypothetical protein
MITVKHGDTHETTWTTNLDLTGATTRLLAKNVKTKLVTILATSPDGVNSVKHKLTGTLAAGKYEVELEATYAAGIITSPTGGYETLCVVPDIA